MSSHLKDKNIREPSPAPPALLCRPSEAGRACCRLETPLLYSNSN